MSVNLPINVVLRFFCDDSGYRVASGEITTHVSLLCQRCVEVMDHQIVANVEWIAVYEDSLTDNLPKHYDPWILEEQGGNLYNMVEDEILLALPIIAFHRLDECKGKASYTTAKVESRKSDNPFEALQKLKFPR